MRSHENFKTSRKFNMFNKDANVLPVMNIVNEWADFYIAEQKKKREGREQSDEFRFYLATFDCFTVWPQKDESAGEGISRPRAVFEPLFRSFIASPKRSSRFPSPFFPNLVDGAANSEL